MGVGSVDGKGASLDLHTMGVGSLMARVRRNFLFMVDFSGQHTPASPASPSTPLHDTADKFFMDDTFDQVQLLCHAVF